ncbi:MAG: prephenate dehydratase [Candidatus Dormibacteria bacterium]
MPEQIGYQGEPGAYSDEACRSLFPGRDAVGNPTFAAAFGAVLAGQVQAAVLPVENSRAGVVQEVSDLLWQHSELGVVAEYVMAIRHQLLSRGEAPVTRAWSHPQALAQCADWLNAHGIVPVPFPDTAGAARHVATSGVPGDGAIASARAAELYGLVVVAENVADEPSNQTRFVVVTRTKGVATVPSGPAKVTMGFVVKHRPGGLVSVLQLFSTLGLNLSRLDSRPIPDQPFRYRFYADVELADGAQAPDLLRRLQEVSEELRPFGVYPIRRECSRLQAGGESPAS